MADTVEIVQVYGRNQKALAYFENHVPTTSSIHNLATADIYLMAISDDAITAVGQALTPYDGLIIHTSGSVQLNRLPAEKRGVFYPLQTFTKGKRVDWSKIPICIETENETDHKTLQKIGKALNATVYDISSQQRKKLHLSAVLVNNFTNHLFAIAHEICKEHDLSFDLLMPLISETVDKVRHLSPNEAQTGPARRNDAKTLQQHLEQLKPQVHKNIYESMSASIKTYYEKEL